MQFKPMTPMLEAPGTKRLKLNCDEPLSSSASGVILRCYMEEAASAAAALAYMTNFDPAAAAAAALDIKRRAEQERGKGGLLIISTHPMLN